MDRKTIALEFLQHARLGQRDAAAALVTADAKHHNPYFAAGMPALLDAMIAAAVSMPDREMHVKHVVAEGDFVAVHSHIIHRSGELGVAVMHLFRFEGDRIAELWDLGQPVPADNKNTDGMF
ncbi:MAG TPA: nuclear transport factor 2 family protein [Planctomycetaceae bacterium]|jgi:predicted SnoaL-like aldol condensation-catalyzing enzyme|nr:nuclear transport factor 2 family protein [Planctomycetaceae bacterium]